MSQLWNTFNTLQILIALTQMSIVIPSNIKLVNDILEQIINFQPIDVKVVQKIVVSFMYGENED